MSGSAVTATIGSSGFAVQLESDGHTLAADEPAGVGGTDTGPTPYGYLLGGLGSCMLMTLRMYADRKQWPLDGAAVTLSHQRVHHDDCDDADRPRDCFITEITVDLELRGPDLTPEQHDRLRDIARRCPVHKTLTHPIRIVDAE